MKFVDFLKDKTLKESSLSRILKHAEGHECGTITAFRYRRDCGEGERLSTTENKNNNAKLKAYLLSKGYGVTPIKGAYIENYDTDKAIEVKEDSFFVVDLEDKGDLEQELRKLGHRYEQDSIAFMGKDKIWYLIGTNHCASGYPGFDKSVRLGEIKLSKTGEFLSRVRNRPFVFEEVGEQDTLLDLSIGEIRSAKATANSIFEK